MPAVPLPLNVGRGVGYTCILAGTCLVCTRTVVLNNNILTSGIILITAGIVTMLAILDRFRDYYVQGLVHGQAAATRAAKRSTAILTAGRVVGSTCILAGTCLVFTRTFVLNNSILTSGIILTTVGIVTMLAIIDSFRDSYVQAFVREQQLAYATNAAP